MSKCIQPSCNCTGYKEPAQHKSTLLQFKLSCQECGHQASEHRKQTAVDQFIKAQITTGKRNKCTSTIPCSEILLSPVFSKYDLIPIPRDHDSYSVPSMDGNSVQCTCKGFQTSDLIRLCQKFRTHLLSDVTLQLKDTPCSFCKHPLSSHASSPPKENKEPKTSLLPYHRKPALGAYEGLTLRNSSLLAFTPTSPTSLQLLTPLDLTDKFMLVAVGKFQDSDKMKLALVSHDVSNDSVKGSEDSIHSEVDEERVEEVKRISDPASRKRKLPTNHDHSQEKKRRSRRLAEIQFKKEEDRIKKQLKGLKGSEREVEMSDDDNDINEKDDEFIKFMQQQLNKSSVGFIKHLDKCDNYQEYTLPLELLDKEIIPLMAALRITVSLDADLDTSQDTSRDTDQESVQSRILLAVGSKRNLDIFVAILHCEVQVTLDWRKTRCEGEGRVECLLLAKTAESARDTLLVAGTNTGFVCVWKVVLEKGSLQDLVCISRMQLLYPGSQLVALSCSPDAKIIMAGTMLGEVVYCFLTNEEHVAGTGGFSLSCCHAPVKCITWSEDGRLVAVGGCDDVIQVLHCMKPQKEDSTLKKSSMSILNYVKRTAIRPKLVHTHSLKGHCSFIADLKFTDNHFLVSVGWDGQILFWKHLSPKRPSRTHQRRTHPKGNREDIEVMEPVGGYKLGPSPAVDFLPLSLHSVMECGLLIITMTTVLGGTTIASYSKH